MSSNNYFSLHSCKERLSPEEVRKFVSTYSEYLEIPTLINLQDSKFKNGIHHHEEHLFIVVHQSFELWFKQILLDLYSVRSIMDDGTIRTNPEKEIVIMERLDRAEKILKFTLGTFDLLETMPSLNFLEFRDYITPASGFQSAQYKELEVLLGQRHFTSGKYLSILQECDLDGYNRVKSAMDSPSFKDLLYQWMESLYDNNIDLMEEFLEKYKEARKANLDYILSIKQDDDETKQLLIDRDYEGTLKFLDGESLSREEAQLYEQIKIEQNPSHKSDTTDSKEETQQSTSTLDELKKKCRKRRIAILFVSCYRYTPEIANMAKILESAINLEQAFLIWKYRHARMVERMIGHKIGTGGSSGVDYLDMTTKQRIFHDLWHVRSHLITPTSLPHLETFKNWIPTRHHVQESS